MYQYITILIFTLCPHDTYISEDIGGAISVVTFKIEDHIYHTYHTQRENRVEIGGICVGKFVSLRNRYFYYRTFILENVVLLLLFSSTSSLSSRIVLVFIFSYYNDACSRLILKLKTDMGCYTLRYSDTFNSTDLTK